MKLLILFRSALVIGVLLCCACGKKHRTSSVKNVNQETAGGQVEIYVDSLNLKKYLLTIREKQELGPGITRFYQDRDYLVAWCGANGPGPLVGAFISRLEHAADEGLRPSDYRIALVKSLTVKARGGSEKEISELDLLLTSEFSRYAADLSRGITRFDREETGWFVDVKPAKYDSLLRVAMSDTTGGAAFASLEPKYPQYQRLKKLLAGYRTLAKKGGWPAVNLTGKLKIGDTSSSVIKIRELLAIGGDLQTGSANFFNPKIFDRDVELGVRRFQARNGLNPDGIVAGATLAALNVPVQDRIRQVLLNMERWRLMPDEMRGSYLFVNVPEFKLHVFENSKESFQMRVVVGKEFKATPIFSDKLEYIVFSPYWNVPKSITEEEILPAVAKNYNFLTKNNMEVMEGWDPKTAHTVPFWDVPWSRIDEDDFDYWVRQKPGGQNPLGLVKFVFPNTNNVYLHDTPFGLLFDKIKRNYSHGCIRIADPVKLARWLLRSQPSWDAKAIDTAMHAGEEQYVHVPPIPVYIVYFTAWVEDDGTVQVRDDIYGMDEKMAALIE